MSEITRSEQTPGESGAEKFRDMTSEQLKLELESIKGEIARRLELLPKDDGDHNESPYGKSEVPPVPYGSQLDRE